MASKASKRFFNILAGPAKFDLMLLIFDPNDQREAFGHFSVEGDEKSKFKQGHESCSMYFNDLLCGPSQSKNIYKIIGKGRMNASNFHRLVGDYRENAYYPDDQVGFEFSMLYHVHLRKGKMEIILNP